MRIKTSITLAKETIGAIDRASGRAANRSRFIEKAVLSYLTQQDRHARDVRERHALDAIADELNEEMEDVLAYQAKL